MWFETTVVAALAVLPHVPVEASVSNVLQLSPSHFPPGRQCPDRAAYFYVVEPCNFHYLLSIY